MTNPRAGSQLQLVTESVIQAYEAVLRAQRALEIREEALRMSREFDCLMVEQAERGEAAPAVTLEGRAGLVRATSAVLRARRELGRGRKAGRARSLRSPPDVSMIQATNLADGTTCQSSGGLLSLPSGASLMRERWVRVWW